MRVGCELCGDGGGVEGDWHLGRPRASSPAHLHRASAAPSPHPHGRAVVGQLEVITIITWWFMMSLLSQLRLKAELSWLLNSNKEGPASRQT